MQGVQNIYLVGIKGSGMSSLARLLQKKGYIVTGADVAEKFYTDQVLLEAGIEFHDGFAAEHIKNTTIDLVVYSTAYDFNNEELATAQEMGIPVLTYPEMIAKLFNDSYGIAVSGTEGKTTTSAMLAYVLKQAGKNPTAVIGSSVPQFGGGGALVGSSDLFVLEADEFQNKLKLYEPKSAIMTLVTYDHPDYFKTQENYQQVFFDFAAKIPESGYLVACGDDEVIQKIIEQVSCSVKTYGFNDGLDYVLRNSEIDNGINKAELYHNNEKLGDINLQLPGNHNLLNATAVIIQAEILGVPVSDSLKFLAEFTGTARRFERKGEYQGALLIDDYAHSPQAVGATLKAAKEFYPNKKLWCAFQPHTYTRTHAFLDDFAKSLTLGDEIVIIDIFSSAREKGKENLVSSQDLVKAVQALGATCHYLPTVDAAVAFLSTKLAKNDILITMGAGDAYKIAEQLVIL